MLRQQHEQNVESTDWEILLIDDDEDDFLITRDMLRSAKGRKCRVSWASSFEEGRGKLLACHYDAVLVDYDLGLHSGIDLIREANAGGCPSPLILYTGRGNYEVDVEAMQAGATLYLTKKEANPLLLERVIRYAIELKHKEQLIRESEAREHEKAAELDAILDTVPAIVWVTHDPDAEKVTGNQAAHELQGIPPGQNISLSNPQVSKNVKVYSGGRELAPDELPLQKVAASGQPIRNFEEEVVFPDGARRILLGNVTPHLDENGNPKGAVAAFIDITERKRAEENQRMYVEQLTRSNQDLQNFAFVASHDLQEPLRKVIRFSEILEKRLTGYLDEEGANLMYRLRAAAQRMQEMIKNLLDLSRVITQGQPFETCDLNEIAGEVIGLLEDQVERTRGSVEIDRLPVIEADPTQMRQLLLNMIGNALKFHKPGHRPEVRVFASPAPARTGAPPAVVLVFEDHGIGFDVQNFHRILEPFQRLGGLSDFEGTGIGLAICKRIIDRHHGAIDASSSPGEGTVFHVTLPIRQNP